MIRNRVAYLLFLISTAIFASFYGGNITYILFFTTLFLPVFCLFYTAYVNARFKIHQTIPKVRLVKMESVPYHFVLANEDFFTFTSIKVSFYDKTSHVSLNDHSNIYCLGPNSNKKIDGTVYGDYRGTYEIGAVSVEITDFLGLFRVTYAIKSPLRLIVSPRILTLENLNLTSFIKDSTTTKNAQSPVNQIVDTELRKYTKGDNKKLIHWKASAKEQTLLTKKMINLEEFETLLFIDLQKVSTEDAINLVSEDKVVELSLAIANHFLLHLIPLRIIYQDHKKTEVLLHGKKDLNNLYEQCINFKFQNTTPIHTLIRDYCTKHLSNDYYIIISPNLNRDLFENLFALQKKGKQITFFYIRTSSESSPNHLLQVLKNNGVVIYDIWMDEDLLKTFVS